MIDFIINRYGRPDDLIETRESPSLTGSMLERTGIVRDGDHHRLLDDAAFAVRAVAFAVFLILAVGLTRPNWDLGRDRWLAGIADRTGDGALTSARTA